MSLIGIGKIAMSARQKEYALSLGIKEIIILHSVLTLIDAGDEYPNASWKTSEKFSVKPSVIGALYDGYINA